MRIIYFVRGKYYYQPHGPLADEDPYILNQEKLVIHHQPLNVYTHVHEGRSFMNIH